jgi:hypothetical protein
MKKSILTLIALLALTISHGQNTFEKTYGGIIDDKGRSVTATSDGGYMLATGYNCYSNQSKRLVIKIDSQGDTLWTQSYPFLDSLSYCVQFTSVIQTNDSNFVLVGGNIPYGETFILKIDMLGDTLWFKQIDNSPNSFSYIKIAEDHNENLIIVGSGGPINVGGCCTPIMSKFDKNGNLIQHWNISCLSFNGCGLSEIFIDNEGNYLVSGMAPNGSVPSPRLIKIDTSGVILWDKIYSITYATIEGITQEQDSSYLLVGANHVSFDSTQLFKTDNNGNLIFWKKYKESVNNWQGASIDTTNGGYLISGGYNDIYLMKIDLNYNFLWIREFGDSLEERCEEMISTSDGGAIIIGSTKSYGAGGSDVYLIKTDQNGLIVGQSEIESKENLLIYPNPFSSQTILKSDNIFKDATLIVYNIHGQIVKQIKNISGKTTTISRDNLPSGLYFLHITEDNKTFSVAKLLITD